MDVTCDKKERDGLPREFHLVGGCDGDQSL
jgi:hypothetical protein